MFRIAVCIALIAAGWFTGFAVADAKRKSYDRICGVIYVLGAMEDGISYARFDLYDIFEGLENRALAECGFLACLNASRRIPACTAWQNAAETLSLTPEEDAVMRDFGATLGLLELDAQLERISALRAFFENQKQKRFEKLTEKLRSYRLLGALGGCLAAIVLY